MIEKQLCILAVDDCIDVLELIKFSLEATTKWRVLLSSSGKQGLVDAQRELPDIILTDFQMPDMDGIELINELRSQPKTKYTPIVLLTSLPQVISSKIQKELDICKVIKKPFDWFTLADLIVLGLESKTKKLSFKY